METNQIVQTIKGSVTKVTTSKTNIQLKMGIFDQLDITISDGNTTVTVQKLAKTGNNGQGFIGKQVHVTYTTQNGFNKTDSKGFIILEQGAAPIITGSSNVTSNTSPSLEIKTRPAYNSDGARHGMIVNNAIVLAGLRKTQGSLDGLKKAAVDVRELTQFVESGSVLDTSTELKETLSSETASPFTTY